MAYSELIKSFNHIRAYMRAFYVYGFRRRGEYDQKSARGYDNERRRVESWLGEYMGFRQDGAGRRFFLSVDSRAIPHNPLYRAFRAKSFTDRDIMLHFHLMDILPPSEGLKLFDIMERLSGRLNAFDDGDCPDDSTVRRKLGEYVRLGIVVREKRGREILYRRAADDVRLESWRAAIDFFSEAAPLGVIGDFCGDRLSEAPSPFRFKHHYILNALDSELLLQLAEAIGEGREAALTLGAQRLTAVPVKLYISVQTGRQYVLVWRPASRDFCFYRLDMLDDAKALERAALPADIDARLEAFQSHVWGVSHNSCDRLFRLEMTICALPEEAHIPARLEREKRCGQVEQLDETHWRFTAEVYDALEMLPWIRTFTGRIVELKCDDPRVTGRFRHDTAVMAGLYGGDGDAVP